MIVVTVPVNSHKQYMSPVRSILQSTLLCIIDMNCGLMLSVTGEGD